MPQLNDVLTAHKNLNLFLPALYRLHLSPYWTLHGMVQDLRLLSIDFLPALKP